MAELPVNDELLDDKQEPYLERYCAPLFIANRYFGLSLVGDRIDPIKKEKDYIRSGTITFINFENELYALSCRHVLDSLDKRNEEQYQSSSSLLLEENFPYGFWIVSNGKQVRFNAKLRRLRDSDLDIVIAKIDQLFLDDIAKEATFVSELKLDVSTGIACGYPEAGRSIKTVNGQKMFGIQPVVCIANLRKSRYGQGYLDAEIEEHNGVDELSGMSGGPVIWSDGDNYGLAGIKKKGWPIQPHEERGSHSNHIHIQVEQVTTELLRVWIAESF